MKTAKKTVRHGRRPSPGGPKQPFSLILGPDELSILRKIARKEKTSVACVVRQALHTVIFRNRPELARAFIEKEMSAFLDSIGDHVPGGLSKNRRRVLTHRVTRQLMSR